MQIGSDTIPVRGETARERRGMTGLRDSSLIGYCLIVTIAAFLLSSGCVTESPGIGTPHQAPGVLVEYSRIGGIAAFDDRIVIFDNGQAVYSRRNMTGEFTLPADRLAELKELLKDADFASLSPAYPAPTPGADYFSYTLTYGEKTITTETGGIPDALVAVIGRLDGILTDYTPLG